MRFILTASVVLSFLSAPALASLGTKDDAASVVPPELHVLQSLQAENNPYDNEKDPQPMDIRMEALKNAALSYGARGGLAMRTFEIRGQLRHTETQLDKTFNFNRLLIQAPSGLLIEPPIITEAMDALLIEGDGQEAAVAEAILNINQNARIVSTSRNWRNYLEREWGDVAPPPDLLRPQNKEERALWREWVLKGWEEGYKQADEIFEADLNRLTRDFEGMVRYRLLLTQNMISAPFALHEDRGVTGGGDKMRIGDRAIRITGPSQLQATPESWQPASR